MSQPAAPVRWFAVVPFHEFDDLTGAAEHQVRSAIDSQGFAAGVWAVCTNAQHEERARALGASPIRLPLQRHDAAEVAATLRAIGERIGAGSDVIGLYLNAAVDHLGPGALARVRERFEFDRPDTLVSAMELHTLHFAPDGSPLNAVNPRHEAGPVYMDAEVFYAARIAPVVASGSLFSGRTAFFEEWMLDSADDAVREEATPIALFVMDVDGVLTDAGFYYSETGEALKKFSTRDGAGIVHLRKSGIELGIITGESTGFAPSRAKKLGIERVELGCSNKLPVLDAWRQELGLEWEQIAYIGDDLADIPCIEAAGVGACPCDAQPEVREAADLVLDTEGGKGAVRELIRRLQTAGRVPR